MKRLLILALLLTGCSSVRLPIPPPVVVIPPPQIALKCGAGNSSIQIFSPTPIFVPLLEVPRFPDGSNPVRYQFADFTGLSEVLELTWCPVSATLEYSRVAGGERFKVVR